MFGRLLDHQKGGHFAIRPVGSYRSRRQYVGPTNVLATTFETQDGAARVTDLMPALTEEQKRHRLMPFRQILRRIDGLQGAVELEVTFAPRLEYGSAPAHLERRSPYDVCCQVGRHLLHLRSDVPLAVVEGHTATARVVVGARSRHHVALAYSEDAPAVFPNLGEAADQDLDLTLDFWRAWSSQLSYRGPHADAVLRSALALKLLAYAPSGAIVAAPTTSLPEHIGGTRNWDYRYCWLRDASFTAHALYGLGFRTEAEAFCEWLMHATRLTHPAFQSLYSVYGETAMPERSLEHLEGYRGSSPVRVGNDARVQFQLDVYGEVLDAVLRFHEEGGDLDRDMRRLVVGAAHLVADRWAEPDHGIWETRAGKLQHVHSKVMAWVALDRAARIVRRTGIRADVNRWNRGREAIRDQVFRAGFNPTLQSFVGLLGGIDVDASLLRLPLVGFIPAADPRMVSTIQAIRRHLGRDELVYRYLGVDDGLPGGEGAFLPCSFWLVSSLALAGHLDEAHAMFSRLLSRGNDLGLFSEEVDPDTGELLGNFPQGLTHIALINAALVLQREESGKAPQRVLRSAPVVGASQSDQTTT